MRISLRAALLGLALGAAGCKTPDPKAELEISGIETYWVVDPAKSDTQFIAPAIRFEVRNKGSESRSSIQATASFHHKGEEGIDWGSDWQQIVPPGKSLAPGQRLLVVLRSDARYTQSGPPESMFQNAAFRDATTELFLRVGSSGWVKFGRAEIERRIGSRSVQADTR